MKAAALETVRDDLGTMSSGLSELMKLNTDGHLDRLSL